MSNNTQNAVTGSVYWQVKIFVGINNAGVLKWAYSCDKMHREKSGRVLPILGNATGAFTISEWRNPMEMPADRWRQV